VQRAVSRKTLKYTNNRHCVKTCMGKFFVPFKNTRPVSRKEGELLYRIPEMLRQQQCCKFAFAGRNAVSSLFREFEYQNAAFSEF
jgi:hypothetical protein